MAVAEPQLLGGRYQLGGILGYGGMAEVHLGRDVRLGRDVAVKTLRADLARDPTSQSRFRREAQSAASLNHRSIVAVYDTGDEMSNGTGVPYIVMEYVEGRTLRDVLQAEGPLMPERALEVTAEVCEALEHAHRAGIVHRDIKPANVMLTPTGAVKVMDFGIARAVTASAATMTQTAAVIGTAQYLSPEQARGEQVDARSDIYSTGCLLYELLTGQPPFTGDSPVAVAYQHVREDPVPPSQLARDLPRDVDAIVLKAMAKNPANRYQTAEEMREDIERALAGRSVLATPVLVQDATSVVPPVAATGLVPPRRDTRRRRRALLLGLLALLLLGVAAFFIGRAINHHAAGVNTPDVRGLTVAQATQRLRDAGLKVGQETTRFTGRNDAGDVVDQKPAPDAVVASGSAVDLVVSQGIQTVKVPQLVGLTQDSAKAALADANLTVAVRAVNANVPAGTVTASNPESGQTVPVGSTVTLSVSNGKVPVPDVTGQDQGQATTRLQEAGFQVNVTQTHAPGKPANVVVQQSPAGGTVIARGSTVTISVNTPPSPSPSASPSGSPSASASPHPPAG